MTVAFLVGNGFDLALGLKTKFEHFNAVYIEKADPPGNSNKLKALMKKQILSCGVETWADFEKKLGEELYRFSYVADNRCADKFFEDLRDFTHELSGYLKGQCADFHGRVDITRFMLDVRRLKELIECWDISAINFINFNYTDVFDKYTDHAEYNGCNVPLSKPIHIHGTTTEALILGVDNESQIHRAHVRAAKAVGDKMIKPYLNAAIDSYKVERAKRLIQESSVVCVYGMSLGVTDETWWKCICEWLQKDDTHRLFIFAHSENGGLFPADTIAVKSNTKKAFRTGASINNDDFKKIEGQISIKVNSDPFGLKNAAKEPVTV